MQFNHLIEKIKNDPIKSYLYLERYFNQGTKIYSPFADQTEADYLYQPTNPRDAFELPCVIIPKEKVCIFLDDPSRHISNFYIREDVILFPIHPEIFHDEQVPFIEELKRYPKTKSLMVAPTASTRTVMTIKEDTPHFIKLHYPKRISRFIRRLRENTIKNCLSVSQDIQSLTGIAYLPETMGIAYGTSKEAWGFLIRECTPRPFQGNDGFLIPLFALYSQDMNAINDPPLLIQLIQYFKEDPATFVLNHIFKPIIRNWCLALTERGFLLEAHGQNTLLELNAKFYPSRIVYRDLDVYVDREIRKKNGLHLNFSQSHQIEPEKRQALYSLKYDFFMGHHLFDYLTSLLNRYYGISSSLIQNICKEYFHSCFPNSGSYFSDKTFYYSNEILPENKYKLIETSDKPNWR